MSFKITGPNGFHITFPNGWTASVQWGVGTYSDNRDRNWQLNKTNLESNTAEVACWKEEGKMVNIWDKDPSDDVSGWLTELEVIQFLKKVSEQ